MKLTIFLIRHPEMELYSSGGSKVAWVPLRQAKLWKNRGHVIRHLQMMERLGGMTEEYRRAKVLVIPVLAAQQTVVAEEFLKG